ncbi:hypothetical protein NL676_020366 [Syzygium grande]|nr:hypothetical protein NL676_020366 [Syzygium grande]
MSGLTTLRRHERMAIERRTRTLSLIPDRAQNFYLIAKPKPYARRPPLYSSFLTISPGISKVKVQREVEDPEDILRAAAEVFLEDRFDGTQGEHSIGRKERSHRTSPSKNHIF